MIKRIALVFGAVFLAVGFLGFVPEATPGNRLFGSFSIHPAHNVFHLTVGAIAVVVSLYSERASLNFFRTFGIIYGVLAFLGFVMAPDLVFGVPLSSYDNVLHLLTAVVGLYIGFGFQPKVSGVVKFRPEREQKDAA